MQTCKLRVEPNFLFQLCPSFSFMMVWYMCQKTVTAVTNTNQRAINEHRTGSEDFKLFKFRQKRNVSLIFTFMTAWCEAKGWGCSHHICGVCGRQVNPVSSAEPQLSCWAPVFCKHKHTLSLHNNRYSSPPQDLSWKDSYSLSQFLCLGLFPSCAVAGGCQQATTADTDGSPGLWWLPYVTVYLQVCAFFTVFLSVSHLFFCFSLENAPLGLRGGVIQGQMWYQLICFSTE